MKRTSTLLAAVALTFFTSCNRVQPNYEGILVKNWGRTFPNDYQSVTGAQGILWFGTTLYQVPMTQEQGKTIETKVQTKDAGVFTCDPQYFYHPLRGHGAAIIYNYRKYDANGADFMDNIEKAILDNVAIATYKENAWNYTTDSLMTHQKEFESVVQASLSKKFEALHFGLEYSISNLIPPESMTKAIEARNNAIQQAEQVKNELQTSKNLLEKARIDAETNAVQSRGLTKEILTQQWIEAIKTTQNKVIITDGKTPVMLGN